MLIQAPCPRAHCPPPPATPATAPLPCTPAVAVRRVWPRAVPVVPPAAPSSRLPRPAPSARASASLLYPPCGACPGCGARQPLRCGASGVPPVPSRVQPRRPRVRGAGQRRGGRGGGQWQAMRTGAGGWARVAEGRRRGGQGEQPRLTATADGYAHRPDRPTRPADALGGG